MSFQPGKILTICPVGLGNYLLSTPSIRLLKTAWPRTELHLLSLNTFVTELSKKNPLITRVIELDVNRFSTQCVFRTVKALRSESYDASFAFFPTHHWMYNIIPFVSGISKRFGFSYLNKRPGSLSYLQNRTIDVSDELFDVEQNLALACYATEKEKPKNVFIEFPPVNEAPALEYLEKQNLLRKKLIGFHPGSSTQHGMINKRWPAGQFAELARMLVQQHGVHVLVFGGPNERWLKEEVAMRSEGAATAVEAVDLLMTASLIKQCRLFVSNDSGLMHVAAALGVNCAGIFGPTDNQRTAPWGEGHIVIGKPMNCRPCWRIDNVGTREKCYKGHVPCLTALNAEDVYREIKKFTNDNLPAAGAAGGE